MLLMEESVLPVIDIGTPGLFPRGLILELGLGHAYFIAFYALKNKAKIRESKKPGFNRGFKCGTPPPAFPSFLLSLSVTLLSVS